jgi:hypothetical protein
MKVYAPMCSVALDWGIDNQCITNNKTLALDQTYSIAAVPALCTEPYMYCYQTLPVDLELSQFDLVIISDIEFYSVAVITQWIQAQGIKNYVLAVGGIEHNEILDASRVVYRPWWVYNCLQFNQYQDTQSDHKPLQFEMLLGARRPHRDFAMLSFQQTDLLASSVVTYRSVFQGHTIDACSQQIANLFLPIELNYPYISPNLDPNWEVSDNINYQISPFIPWEIYANTNYSVVCETLGMGNTFFMSEKAAKVLFGKRLFVAFAAQNYLRYLQQLGFKTFNNIIDESYDSEPNYLQRYQLVFKQIQYLNSLDPAWVLSQAESILEHNHRQLSVLQQQTQQQMIKLVQSYL